MAESTADLLWEKKYCLGFSSEHAHKKKAAWINCCSYVVTNPPTPKVKPYLMDTWPPNRAKLVGPILCLCVSKTLILRVVLG